MAKQLNKKHVNIVNTPTWVSCNDDARASTWRQQFINENGGEFYKAPKGNWAWRETPKQEPQPILETWLKNQKVFVFDKDGSEVKVHNMTEYCRDNKYSRAALYEVTSGKRKSYKGHTYLRQTVEDVLIRKN